MNLPSARADFVIDNHGTLTQLESRVADVWAALVQGAEAREHAGIGDQPY